MTQAIDSSRLHLSSCLIAAGVVGAWTHDTATGRVIADTAVAGLFGISRPDCCNGDPLLSYVAAIYPADRPSFAAAVDAAAKRGTAIALQYRVRSNGGIRLIRDYGSFSVDENGRPFRGQGIVIDATFTQNRDASDTAEEVAALRALDPGLSHDIVSLTEHVVAASEIVRTLPSARLRNLTDSLLWEVGRLLAWATSSHIVR